MPMILAVDAGGTSTRCILADEKGAVWGFGRAGAGNPLSAGRERSLNNLVSAIESAAVNGPAAEVVVVSLAGGLGGNEVEGLDARLAAVGLSPRIVVVSDIAAAYLSGCTESFGYVLVSGTGAVAGRVENGALLCASDGLGWLVGDEGSGFWIGREAVIAAARDLQGRGRATCLTPLVCDRFEVSLTRDEALHPHGFHDLLSTIYAQRPVELAKLAELVLHNPDDEVCADILERAALALIKTWKSVQTVSAPTVLAGGVLSVEGPLRWAVQAALGKTLSVTNGIAGAGILGLRELGYPGTEEQRRRLQAGVSTCLA